MMWLHGAAAAPVRAPAAHISGVGAALCGHADWMLRDMCDQRRMNRSRRPWLAGPKGGRA